MYEERDSRDFSRKLTVTYYGGLTLTAKVCLWYVAINHRPFRLKIVYYNTYVYKIRVIFKYNIIVYIIFLQNKYVKYKFKNKYLIFFLNIVAQYMHRAYLQCSKH